MDLSRLSVMSVCLALGACASAWQVPESVTRASAGLNATTAEASLRKALVPSANAHGLCGRITAGPSHPGFLDLRGGELTFTDSDTRVTSARANVSAGTVSTTTRQVEGVYSFDFKSVDRVFIMGPVEPGQCAKAPANRPLMIRSEGMLINVDLAPENYEPFLAALMFMAPQARFTQGAGL